MAARTSGVRTLITREIVPWDTSYELPAERAIANITTWRILHTDCRRPLRTLQDTFHAVIGLYWFKINKCNA